MHGQPLLMLLVLRVLKVLVWMLPTALASLLTLPTGVWACYLRLLSLKVQLQYLSYASRWLVYALVSVCL